MKGELHAEVDGLQIALTMFARFPDEQLVIADDDADEALVAEYIATLRVSVRQSAVGEFAQTAVLTL